MHIPAGTRVEVYSGDAETPLGLGTYEGSAMVYFAVMPDGSLRSHHDARIPITRDDEPEAIHFEYVPDNPVIKLDSGRYVYGCQVWWGPVRHAS